ncbi:hypothetical protein C8R46DRAFT_1198286 [Mycena filopes]|nr:hypothetical protein C8R46DRAFT_1198286 [Mycena filopes]
MGTADGGAATTFLYQAVNAVAVRTTNQVGPTTVLTTTAALRTIVASASGWSEALGDLDISCQFINDNFGRCLDIRATTVTTANSGLPTPVVLSIESQSDPPSITHSIAGPGPSSSAIPSPIIGTPIEPSTGTAKLSEGPSMSVTTRGATEPSGAADLTGRSKAARTRIIVGSAIGGACALLIILTALLCCRRRRARRMNEERAPHAYDAGLTSSNDELPVQAKSFNTGKDQRSRERPVNSEASWFRLLISHGESPPAYRAKGSR